MNSKEKIIQYLKNASGVQIKDFLLVSGAPNDVWIHGAPRILLLTRGEVSTRYFHSGKYELRNFGQGSAFYCGKRGYLYTVYSSPCEIISITFYTNYLRIMNILYDGKNPPPTEKDTFYHTESPLSETGNTLINILDKISLSQEPDALSPHILSALLISATEEIQKSKKGRLNPSVSLWSELDYYIRSHPDKTISRSFLARHFKISPGYISHLFKKFTGQDLVSAITTYKLEYASRLLQETNLPLKEISARCGFAYTSYFIRCFKKYYGMTPRSFRMHT